MKKVFSVLFLLPALAAAPAQGAGVDALAYQMCEMTHKPEMRCVNVSPVGVALELQPCEIDVSETRPNLYGGMQILGFDDRDIEEDLKQMARPLVGQVTVSQDLYDMHEAIRACSEEARTDMGEKFQKNEAFLASIFPG